MAKLIGILGAKGGVGKTTTAINLGVALASFGRSAMVVDANLTTPNVGLHLGVPTAPVHLQHVLSGKKRIKDAVYSHSSGIKIVPSSISVHDLKYNNAKRLKRALYSLRGMADIVLVDAAAGLGEEAIGAIDAVDEIVIVSNPEILSVTDTLKTIKMAEKMGKEVIGIVITRASKRNLDLSINDIESLLEKPVIGVIPEDKAVRKSLVRRDAVVRALPNSRAAIAYKKLAASLIGENYEQEYTIIDYLRDFF